MANEQDIDRIVAGLTKAQREHLTTNWDAACDCDWGDVTTETSNFFERQEAAGFAQCVHVTEDDVDGDFAWERGIEIGGRMWELTPLGLAVRTALTEGTGA